MYAHTEDRSTKAVKPVLGRSAVPTSAQSKPALIAARGLSKTYSTSTGEVSRSKISISIFTMASLFRLSARAAAASPHC